MKERDVRTFCYRCFMEYMNAGYKLTKLDKPRSACDKCHRQGDQYELHKQKGGDDILSKLNARQKKFADEYIITGNITQSAIKAGYSESYADSQGYRLLGIVGMQEYIQERNGQLDKEKIADMQEVHEFWANILRDEENSTSDRIKVSELIGKTNGAFLDRVEQTGDMGITVEWVGDE